MTYIAIIIWESVSTGKKVANVIEDYENYHPKYFEDIEQIRESINPNFPFESVLCINLETLEVEEL